MGSEHGKTRQFSWFNLYPEKINTKVFSSWPDHQSLGLRNVIGSAHLGRAVWWEALEKIAYQFDESVISGRCPHAVQIVNLVITIYHKSIIFKLNSCTLQIYSNYHGNFYKKVQMLIHWAALYGLRRPYILGTRLYSWLLWTHSWKTIAFCNMCAGDTVL